MNKKDLQNAIREFLSKDGNSPITEANLTKAQLDKREDYLKNLKKNKKELVKRYGKDAEAVMYGRATNLAKKALSEMNKQKLKELVRKSLMNEADIETMADRIGGEETLSQASMMLDDLEQKLKTHDWFYMMSDDNRAYTRGSAQQSEIRKVIKSLESLGYGQDAKNLYNQYAPYTPGGSDLRMKEGKKEDMDGDGDIDSKDYLAKRDIAIQKAKGEVKEDIDLGHEDNEPHMIKGELYQIGKYAMKLYAILEELEEEGGEYDFPAWWQSKITTAKNMMSSAKHYLDFELKEPAIDAAVDALTGEEYHEGEPELEEGIHDKDILSAPYTNIKTPPKEVGGYDPKKRAANLAALAKFGPKSKDKELEEKKLTAAEKKKKEEIVKGMKDTFKGPKPAMYAIATEKAKKVAEILAKKLKENMDEPVIAEAKKVKFVLYTNPGNSTNAGYVAIGNEDVREVLRDAKKYSDSYKILYQGSGTQDDLVKAKQMFSDYRFGNESIDEKISETLAKKLKENNGADLKKGDTVEYEGKKYKIGSFDEEANLVYLNDLNGKPAEDSKGSYLKVHKTKVK
jgi:hypothetical protein